jgi:hypothetical protein
MTVRLYKSTDASAPVLTGVAGSLVTLLDAILVNGYGSKTAAGWTKPYNATNKGVYLQGAGSNAMYLDVNDAAPTTAKEAQMRGYETMSAVATGTGPFPTVAQSSFGVVCRKSNTADSTARPWYCVADSTCFHLFIDTGDWNSPSYSSGFSFGDIFAYKPGDAYSTLIMGVRSENISFSNDAHEEVASIGHDSGSNFATTMLKGHYMPRTWQGTGSAIQVTKSVHFLAGYNISVTGQPSSGNFVTYPNGPDSGLDMCPILVCHNNAIRGYLKGLWCPLHPQPASHGDTFSGTGVLSSKQFMLLNVKGGGSSDSGHAGQIIVETSDTWS